MLQNLIRADLSSTEIGGMMVGVVAFIVIMIVAASLATYSRHKDDNKPMKEESGKTLEKVHGKLNEEYFLVEFSSGERKRLQSFPAGTICATVGEKGIIRYKGDSIVGFDNKGR